MMKYGGTHGGGGKEDGAAGAQASRRALPAPCAASPWARVARRARAPKNLSTPFAAMHPAMSDALCGASRWLQGWRR